MPKIPSDADPFAFQIDGVDFMKLCLDITIYWVGSVFDRVEGVLDFYQQSMALIGEHVTYYETESMEERRRIRKNTLDLLPSWLTQAKSRRSMYMLYLESDQAPDVPSDRAFVFQAIDDPEEQVGALRLVLPTTFIAESVDGFVELARNLVRKLPFCSGHGGLAVNWNDKGDLASEAEDRMALLSRRFPGIDLPDIGSTLFAIPTGIKRINWLTYLSTDYVEQLGSREEFASVLGPEVIIHSLRYGVLIQAGPRPETGDVNRRLTLPLYHRVGKALAGLRSEQHPAFLRQNDGAYDEEATREWLAAFDS